jgi:hypothetical protein
MALDMMRRLMPQDKGQLVRVPRIGDQRQREADHRAVERIQRLKGIRRLARPVIDDDAEIAVPRHTPLAAIAFRHGLDPRHDGQKGFGRNARRQARGNGDFRRDRRRGWVTCHAASQRKHQGGGNEGRRMSENLGLVRGAKGSKSARGGKAGFTQASCRGCRSPGLGS